MNNGKKFYPDYLFEILVVSIITIEIVLALALLFPPDTGRKIDFNAMYQPRPEWYFLWLYEIVKFFPGKWMFIGTTIIPLAVFLMITLLPFLDKTTDTSFKKRWTVVLIASFLLLLFILLTILAL